MSRPSPSPPEIRRGLYLQGFSGIVSCLPSTRSPVAGDKHTQLNWLAWARADINWRRLAPDNPCGASRGSYQPIAESSSSWAAGSVGADPLLQISGLLFVGLGLGKSSFHTAAGDPGCDSTGEGTCGWHLPVRGEDTVLVEHRGSPRYRVLLQVVGAPADGWGPFPPGLLLRQLG